MALRIEAGACAGEDPFAAMLPGDAMEELRTPRGAVGNKAPCDFCGPTLNNMGSSNRVMTPQAAVQAMPNIAQVFTIQNVPVFR
ncbi:MULTISPECIES: hypothetical protein [Sorangium]|uniref:Uncharacterized protein n=1 Tax=Sorangium cellulosum TaxID=56 RepID=A0A4P2QHV1_SORCE|nr:MULTISPECIES: hypothetical protein [Sorangium]AUX29567.1 uncharacterized protein SOCE836_016580 [Sorangium cellulosum]WCQ88963.1 hypothetical protein NQZ70_01646 [Sorangium sp. Soce836]